MTSSEKYCLKVDEFESSFIDSLRELRASEDLFDVTLVSDDETPVQAHKLVLSASSLFFKNIFKFNKNNHPLLYIRGLKEKDLKNVLEFLYNGEVKVAHDDLDKFLQVAKDLKLKGMYEQENVHQLKEVPGMNEIEKKKKSEKTKSKTALVDIKEKIKVKTEDYNFDDISSKTVVVNEDVEKTDVSIETADIENLVKTESYNFDDLSNIDTTVVNEAFEKTDVSIEVSDIENLDEKIEEMMFKENGLWHCKMCDKAKPKKSNITAHVETNHLNNSIPCKFCEAIARNRPALAMHVRSKHTAAALV